MQNKETLLHSLRAMQKNGALAIQTQSMVFIAEMLMDLRDIEYAKLTPEQKTEFLTHQAEKSTLEEQAKKILT